MQLRLSLNNLLRATPLNARALENRMASVVESSTERIICHCLRVTECEIRSSIAVGDLDSVKKVMDFTGAGSGCTACHCAIKRLLAAQCPPPSSSPTCVIR